MSNTVKLNICPKCRAPIPTEAPQGLCPKCVLLGAATDTEAGVPATATSEIPSLERIAIAFPQLEILELIGRGGMGFVFKARQPHLDRFVALKLLPDKLAKDAQFAERFNREGRVLAKLNHPSIVSVFDFGQTGGFYYLLMEYVDGVNLRQAMRAGRFSPVEALSIVPKVCEALQYAHEQGILHRDIKPENILLDTKGRVKIADFGIAKLIGEEQPDVTLTNTGAALGTLHYMAPEQLEKPSTVDHRADIYSLGVVFYELLTGELPIGRFAAPSSKTPVNTSVDEVVFRTLEKEPRNRYQSAGEMKTQVEHLGEGAGVAAGQGDSAPTGQAARSYSRWSIYGALNVGLSLPAPLMIIVSILAGRGGVGTTELWLALGSVAMPGLGGTLLGWLGLNEIRESGGRVRGLPLAMFATLMWPLSLFGALTLGLPMFFLVPGGEPSVARTVGRFLVLLLPAAVIAFGFWTIHATARWASQQPVPQRRGVLKWVFIGVLLVGMGVIMVTGPNGNAPDRPTPVQEASAAPSATAIEAAPMIQFTFTSVELREEAGKRWLAMDYVEQVRGDCQHTFRYDARVPGFTAQTRMDSGLSDAKAGFEPVLHQRVLWKLPDSLALGDAIALRDLVAKEWIGKSTAIEPDDERVLFKSLVPDGGTLAAAIGVIRSQESVTAPPVAEAASKPDETAEVRSRLAREQNNAAKRLVEADRQPGNVEQPAITTTPTKAISKPLPAIPANNVRAQASTINLLVNPGAETGSLFGWSTDDSPPAIASLLKPVDGISGLPPRSGTFAFHGTLGKSTMSQTQSLLGRLGITTAQIDKGTLYANAGFWTISDNSGDAASIILTFLDAGNRRISTSAGPFISFPNPRYPTKPVFTNYQASVRVPPGTRAIDYSILFKNAQNGKHLASLVDDCSLTISSAPLTNAVLRSSVVKP